MSGFSRTVSGNLLQHAFKFTCDNSTVSLRISASAERVLGIRLAFTTWSSARFFAVTGHGAGDPTADITALLDAFKKLEAKQRRQTLRVVAR